MAHTMNVFEKNGDSATGRICHNSTYTGPKYDAIKVAQPMSHRAGPLNP